MFYIVNHENSIIAADTVFLDIVGADDIFEAAVLLRGGEIKVNEHEQTLLHGDTTLEYTKVPLMTFFGEAYLYQFTLPDSITDDSNEEDIEHKYEEELLSQIKEDEPETTKTPELEDITTKEEVFSLVESEEELESDIADTYKLTEQNDDRQTLSLKDDPDEDSTAPYAEVIGLAGTGLAAKELLDDNSDTFDEIEANDEPILLKESNDEIDNIDELASSAYDTDTSEGYDLETTKEDTKDNDEKDDSTIEDELANFDDTPEKISNIQESSIDTKEIAKLIGITEDECTHFINDFLKESKRLEPELRDNDLKTSKEAAAILKEASLLLHLPHLYEKLNELDDATSSERDNIIDEYCKLVSKVSSYDDNDDILLPVIDEPVIDEPVIDEPVIQINEDKEDTEKTEEIKSYTQINLDDIQAIPFDFSIKEAASELTLPESLVSEFVVDFINQAKENIPVLQQAHQDKDIKKLQSTAHMLKGASSNLRIVPIADTLYDLQLNNDLDHAPEIINKFIGQLKSLATHMNQ